MCTLEFNARMEGTPPTISMVWPICLGVNRRFRVHKAFTFLTFQFETSFSIESKRIRWSPSTTVL
jgi:hypothetical protein